MQLLYYPQIIAYFSSLDFFFFGKKRKKRSDDTNEVFYCIFVKYLEIEDYKVRV